MLKYTQKAFGILSGLGKVTDSRKLPQIPTGVVAKSAYVMSLAKLGSLNALEHLKGLSMLKKHIGGKLPSADSIGRICEVIVSDDLRIINKSLYQQLKRNKGLVPPKHGLMALIVDGHESHASYRRHCDDCLTREIGPDDSKKTQ